MKKLLTTFLVLLLNGAEGILYPKASETREVLSLDGFWNFGLTNSTWLGKIPVPSSYNDLDTSADLRNHVGLVWYQRQFFVPKSWQGQRVLVRFGSVCRGAEVWINDHWAVSHDIDHLPFEGDISSLVNYGGENTIIVAVDNTLLNTTIPQGTVTQLSSGRIKQTYTFDFFNYAGIDRSVVLYTTPTTYIDDIYTTTDKNVLEGIVHYFINVKGQGQVSPRISLLDKEGKKVASDTLTESSLHIQDANFWWPYLMGVDPGYLYSLVVELYSSEALIDKYTLPVGIRTISWDSTSLKINGKNIYLRGFGRHEDSDIRGKGLDLPLIIRDYNLIKWVGANAYRTSHYPYAEEIMDMADELGIMIIDESPAVNTEGFSDELLTNHKQSLTELIARDKNRPSVIMWSASNEPRTQYPESENYYKEIVAHIKSLDTSRPVTVVNFQLPDDDHSGQFIDVASCNLYYGWYFDTGDLDVAISEVTTIARRWHELHNIPVIVSEYGADTLEGYHSLPSFTWSEEFQKNLLSTYFKAFDRMRKEGFLIGELIWNFADFNTDQSFLRVGGNKKGIFTRNRQPKDSAHLLRQRYWSLAQILDYADIPDDLYDYIVSNETVKDEL